MTREDYLNAAKQIVCFDREGQYGSPENNFANIAHLWNAYLDTKGEYQIDAEDVAIMMCLFKIGRMRTGVFKRDNWTDAIGYMACGAEIAELMAGGNRE